MTINYLSLSLSTNYINKNCSIKIALRATQYSHHVDNTNINNCDKKVFLSFHRNHPVILYKLTLIYCALNELKSSLVTKKTSKCRPTVDNQIVLLEFLNFPREVILLESLTKNISDSRLTRGNLTRCNYRQPVPGNLH